MDFRFNEEHRLFRDGVAKFAKKHLAPEALERAHADGYPRDVAKLMAENGLLGITIPEDAGGLGGSLMDAVIAIETVAGFCPRSADVVQAGNFGAIRVLAEYGSDDQKSRFLAPLLAGDKLIAIGMTEPEAGSAVTDLKTTATAADGGYRVTGSKVFTTHSTEADVILAYVRFGPGVGGIGSVLIEKGADGFSLGQPVRYMGGDHWAQVYLEDVFVPEADVVLGAGGFKKQIAGFNVERIGNATRSLALGQLAFDTAVEHAKTRRQFGRALAEFQGLQWKMADARVALDAARLLLYRAAINADHGLPGAEETAIAKLACNRAGFQAADTAVQVMGATGYSEETLVEYCFRRTRGWMIAGGSMEMMQNRIAEAVFEERFSQRPPKPPQPG